MPTLSFNTYGKTRVRLLQVIDRTPLEIEVTILLEGALDESYTVGDNSIVLPTDTMKNTVYVLARQHPIENIEDFGLVLGEHFLGRLPQISLVNIEIGQTLWAPLGNNSFMQNSKEQRIAQVSVGRNQSKVVSGLRNLQILKTAHSSFYGFMQDDYTTLPEASDRLFGTVLDADWTYLPPIKKDSFNEDIRGALLEAFAKHDSLSVQHTLYFMAETVINRFEAIQAVHLVMPNKHNLLFDLARFGLDNPGQIFVPTDEPSGYIEARVTRP